MRERWCIWHIESWERKRQWGVRPVMRGRDTFISSRLKSSLSLSVLIYPLTHTHTPRHRTMTFEMSESHANVDARHIIQIETQTPAKQTFIWTAIFLGFISSFFSIAAFVCHKSDNVSMACVFEGACVHATKFIHKNNNNNNNTFHATCCPLWQRQTHTHAHMLRNRVKVVRWVCESACKTRTRSTKKSF